MTSITGVISGSGEFTADDETKLLALDPDEGTIKLLSGNPADVLTSTVFTEYNDGATKYSGMARHPTDGEYYLYKETTTEPTSATDTSAETRANLNVGTLGVDANIVAANADCKIITASAWSVEMATTTGNAYVRVDDSDDSATVLGDSVDIAASGVSSKITFTDINGVINSNTIRLHVADVSTNPHSVDKADLSLDTTDAPTFAALTTTGDLTCGGNIGVDGTTITASDDLSIISGSSKQIGIETTSGSAFFTCYDTTDNITAQGDAISIISTGVGEVVTITDAHGSTTSTAIIDHIADVSGNPHSVDKADLSLDTTDTPTFAGLTITGVFTANGTNAVFDDIDMDLSNGTKLIFVETGADINTVSFQAPVAVTSDYTVTWPAAQGAADTLLVNDGAGALSFSDDLKLGSLVISGDLEVKQNAWIPAIYDNIVSVAANNFTDVDTMGVHFQYGVTPTYTGLFRKEAGDFYMVESTSAITEAIDPSTLTTVPLHYRMPRARMYIDSSATTTITTMNQAVKCAGTTTGNQLVDFTHSSNKLVYTGTPDIVAKYDINISFHMVTGSNAQFTFYMARSGGTFFAWSATGTHALPSGTDIMNISLTALGPLTNNQYAEVWVANNSGTDNIVCDNLSMTIIALQ